MSTAWDENYSALKAYFVEYGTSRIKENEEYRGYSLGSFVRKCRTDFNAGRLSQERITLLKQIEFVFDPYEEDWNRAYMIAKSYFMEFGDLLVTQRRMYKGFKLGVWVSNQRNAYNNGTRKMTSERKSKLDEIGMVWDANDASWEMHYRCAKKFYEEYGNLDVLVKYEIDGIKLGRWISNQRVARKSSSDSHVMNEDRIKRLDEIGMIWEYANTKQASFPEKAMFYYFKMVFPNAVANDRRYGCEIDAFDSESKIGMEYDGAYYHRNVEKDLAHNAILFNKVKLIRFREKGCPKLTDECSRNIEVEKIDNFIYLSRLFQEVFDEVCCYVNRPLISIDIVRDLDKILKLFKTDTDRFEYWYKRACEYYEEHGNLLVEVVDDNTQRLYNFIGRCRSAYSGKKGKITKDQIKRLEELHMVWNVPDAKVERNLAIAKRYAKKYGDIGNVGKNVIVEGVNLRNFILVMRRAYNEERLNEEIVAQLEAIGMVWAPKKDQWNMYYELLKRIYEREGNISIAFTHEEAGLKVGKWLYHQILAYWKIEERFINEDRIKLLEQLQIDWKPELYKDGIPMFKEKRWMDNYNLVMEYIDRYGVDALNVRTEYKGVRIGTWVSRQRSNNKLSLKKAELLKGLGIKLNIFEEEWLEMFNLVKEYVGQYGWEELKEKTIYREKPIGRWIDTRRQEKKGKRGDSDTLTMDKIRMLDSIGMIWDMYLYSWNKYYFALVDWLASNNWNDLSVHVRHMGLDIGKWVIRQRRIRNGTAKTGKLNSEQIHLLEKVGIVWNVADARWVKMLFLLEEYVRQYGWQAVKCNTEFEGERIGAWIERQRLAYWGKCGRLKISDERVKKLDSIGMQW